MTAERKAELRAAALQLARYLTETPEGRDLQADTDAMARDSLERLDAAEHAAGGAPAELPES